jgi:hypothetical protein
MLFLVATCLVRLYQNLVYFQTMFIKRPVFFPNRVIERIMDAKYGDLKMLLQKLPLRDVASLYRL